MEGVLCSNGRYTLTQSQYNRRCSDVVPCLAGVVVPEQWGSDGGSHIRIQRSVRCWGMWTHCWVTKTNCSADLVPQLVFLCVFSGLKMWKCIFSALFLARPVLKMVGIWMAVLCSAMVMPVKLFEFEFWMVSSVEESEKVSQVSVWTR